MAGRRYVSSNGISREQVEDRVLEIIYVLITVEAVQVDDIVKGEMEKRWKIGKGF